MTDELSKSDAYLKQCEARVIAADVNGIQLDRTAFYAMGGGQPGDTGKLLLEDGEEIAITDTRRDRESGALLHIPAEGGELPEVGAAVTAEIDWERRYRLMHLLCAVVDGGVTGGSVGIDRSRIDFDLPESPDKLALEEQLNRLISEDRPVTIGSISDAELEAQPELIRTMSVKPPTGAGEVRTIRVEGVDYQPCGGTHVASTGEIGRIRVGKVEKKGRQNRRINIHLED
ncbi:alanyl-tRNA editing protein [Solemya velesiana gill symbiont]|uniref:Alanine--tRNA ligase n=1 Tax=Solemya velesiana gill symbiont TaxID=1918948 RepID=A0A1T2KYJ6_9GAMM|nr:alanyl-tRNA editing protein [Solemya velesiana gill symbiont]OOZ37903.1 Ala-tRNA(Pro) hydrolase [Solemya velesiana gill symbiont]